MLNIPSIRILPLAAALALVTTTGMAQDTTRSSTPAASSAITTVGVTPQDTQEAMKKASSNTQTGTLVRTESASAKRAHAKAKDIHPSKTHTPSTAGQQQAPRPAGVAGHKTSGTVTNTTTPSAAMGITGMVPGAKATTGDASNTRDNADKGNGNAFGAVDTAQPMDTMGNRGSSTPRKP
ncbi:hypothetical protein [Simplicispira psychrophila]|uniref:hypothetical protein n=1 Tax=Simplicispira psychrophila TaxID=80882 RepID=UPI0004808197|nr:hypothetical protein [Simplicispira psychrophila]